MLSGRRNRWPTIPGASSETRDQDLSIAGTRSVGKESRVRNKLADCAVVLLLALMSAGFARSADDSTAQCRARLAEMGRLIVREAGSTGASPGSPPSSHQSEAVLESLVREPRNVLRRTIDDALRGGSKEERIGAMALYNHLVSSTDAAVPREPLNGAYPPLFYRLIQEDDRSLAAYTEALAEGFAYYPRSRLTALSYMDIARHTANPATREKYVRLTAEALSIDLALDDSQPVLWKERRLEAFEAWFEKNQRYIKYDKGGRSVLAGSRIPDRQRRMSDAERARVRQEPLCVLHLIETAAGATGRDRAGALESLRRCGGAAFGEATAARLVLEAEAPAETTGASFDLTIRLSAARAGYPWLDAGLLAVATVASDDTDPGHRERARQSLRLLGPASELKRIVSGEPDGVQRKVEEFLRSIE